MTDALEPLIAPASPTGAEIEGMVQPVLEARLGERWPLRAQAVGGLSRLIGRLGSRPAPGQAREAEIAMSPGRSVVMTSWSGVLAPTSVPGSREEHAVRLIYAALRVRQRLERGEWEPEHDGAGNRLDHEPYLRFFSSSLAPHLPDRLRLRRADARHIAVLVEGRAFAVDMVGPGGVASPGALLAALRQCVAQAGREGRAPLALPSLPMTDFHEVYRDLCRRQRNHASLRTLGEALFVVCLDEAPPGDDEALGRALHTGTLGNRWPAHAMQIVVFPDGRAGLVGCSQAGLDGQPALVMLGALAAGRQRLTRAWPEAPAAPWRPLRWELPPGLPDRLLARCEPLYPWSPDWVVPLAFGARDARRLGVPTSAGFYLLLQASWAEARGGRVEGAMSQFVSMRHIEGKRLALHPLVSPAAGRFVDLLRGDGDAAALRAAAAEYADGYARSLRDIKSDQDHSLLVARVASRLRSSPWSRPLAALLDDPGGAPEWMRLSLLERPEGVRLFGRFGTTALIATSLWGHPHIGESSSRLVCSPGPRSPVSPRDLGRASALIAARLEARLGG